MPTVRAEQRRRQVDGPVAGEDIGCSTFARLRRLVRRYCLILSLVLAAFPAAAQQRARAIDGDTIAVGAERIRVMGLDAPELRARCPRELRLARRARDRLAVHISTGIQLEPHGRDRYGRLLAVVRDRSGRDVAQLLIAEGLARPYDGRGPRGGWC